MNEVILSAEQWDELTARWEIIVEALRTFQLIGWTLVVFLGLRLTFGAMKR